MPAQKKPAIVLAHDVRADGSYFKKLIPTLQADGHEVICSQHGLGLAERRRGLRHPVLPGGSAAPWSLSVTLTACAPDHARGRWTTGSAPWSTSRRSRQTRPKPRKASSSCSLSPDVFSHIDVADGQIWPKPDGIGCFAGDLPEAEQKVVWATQAVPVPDLFTQKLNGVAWRSKPSWYIVTTEDRTVNPELQRFVAEAHGRRIPRCAPVTSLCSPNRMPCWT